MSSDLAIPILPARSLEEICAFYRRIGFDSLPFGQPPQYAILTRGSVELHFALDTRLDPATSNAMCYLRVADAEQWHREFAIAELPAHGIPRLEPISDRPWGMREFALVDPSGNLLRIGQSLAAG